MQFRGADRENIVMLTMKYDNFQEFIDEKKDYFNLLKVVTEDEIITKIVKLYIKEQIFNSLSQYKVEDVINKSMITKKNRS